MSKTIFLLVTLTIVFMSSQAQAKVLVVGEGSLYVTIQSAINDAHDGDRVLVLKGTYKEKINFLGKAITVKSVGGPEKTVIDGNASGSVVTFQSNEGNKSILWGFTITHGTGRKKGEDRYGGGIYCRESSPSIINCVISANEADYGGGIYCNASGALIQNCTITGNIALPIGGGAGIACESSSSASIVACLVTQNISSTIGGGIYCGLYSSPLITRCAIENNSSVSEGGGISCSGSSASIIGCTITGNDSWYGGGIALDNASGIISDCLISNNVAGYHGGGINYSYATTTITRCIIRGNTAGFSGSGGDCYGGGISYVSVWSNSFPPSLTNCTIVENSVQGTGGGIACFESSPTIINCTVAHNTASSNGGGIYCEWYGQLILSNCILWGDNGGGIPNEIYSYSGPTVNISYSDVESGWPGTGNIDADPLFAGEGDYHLTAGSPCIDVGTSQGAPADDIDKDSRPQGSGYDMGADEYIPGAV